MPNNLNKNSNGRLLFAILTCAVGSGFQHGYNTGVVNAPQDVMEEFINETQFRRTGVVFTESEIRSVWLFAICIYCFGGMVGSLLVSVFAEKIGRKKGLMVNNFIAVFGGLLLEVVHLVKSYEILILGRFVLGVNSGLNSGLAPLYLSEISPIKFRGAIASTYQLMLTVSILLSQCLGLPQVLGTRRLWPTLFALVIIPPIFQGVAFLFCPQSPRYLYSKTKDTKRIQNVLIWLRGSNDVDDELLSIQQEIKDAEQTAKTNHGRLFSDRYSRSMLGLSISIMMSQQFSGINGVIFFSTDTFTNLGLGPSDAQLATLSIGVVNVITSVFSLWLIERLGRRRLYLINLMLLVIISLLLTEVLEMQMTFESAPRGLNIVAVGVVFAFIIVFASGLGPIPWTIVHELFDQKARSLAVSIGAFVNWTSNFTVSLIFLPVKDVLRGYVFLVFAICLTIAFVIAFLIMPETRNKNPAEVRATFERNSWTQFRGQSSHEGANSQA